MKKRLFLLGGLCAAISTATADELHAFKRIQLNDQFWCEGANFGDLNKDGINDLVSGPWWYEGPDFKKRHEDLAERSNIVAVASSNDSNGGGQGKGKSEPSNQPKHEEKLEGRGKFPRSYKSIDKKNRG